MTRRELINALLDGDMEDGMLVSISNGDEGEDTYPIIDVDDDVLLIQDFYS